MAEASGKRNTPRSRRRVPARAQRWAFLDDAVEWIAFRGQPPEEPREAIEKLKQWRNEIHQHVIEYLRQQEAFRCRLREWQEQEILWMTHWARCLEAAKGEIFAAMQAGDLAFEWRLVDDGPFAGWKAGDLSFLRGFRQLDEVTRSWETASPGDPHWRIAVVPVLREFRVDEVQLRALWAPTSCSPEPEPRSVIIPLPLPGYTREQYERFRAWLLAWPHVWAPRGDSWRAEAVAAARMALKDINITFALLKDVIHQYPDLHANARPQNPPGRPEAPREQPGRGS